VQWDSKSDTFLHPERISPWNIEMIESTNKKLTSIKRTRPLDPPLPGFSSLTRDGPWPSFIFSFEFQTWKVSLDFGKAGRYFFTILCLYPQLESIILLIIFLCLLVLFQSPVEYTTRRHKKVLQGQEIRKTGAQELGAETSGILPHLIYRHLGLENQLCHPMHDQLYRLSSNTIPSPGGNMAAPCPTCQWPPIFTTYAVCDNVAGSRNISVSNVTTSNTGSQECRASESRDENEAPLSQPTGRARYMLFGVNLVNSHPELPSPQVANYCGLCSPCSLSPTSHSSVSETIQVSEPSKDISGVLLEKQCENCFVTSRSCTKVLFFF
jgi:hypothetical protein